MSILDDFLGDFAADLTGDQKADLERVAARIDELFPADKLDDTQPASDALSGAVMLVAGDATAESLAADLRHLRDQAETARQRLAGAMIYETMISGTSYYELGKRTGQAANTIKNMAAGR